LLSSLRGQGETLAYGLPLVTQRNYGRLMKKLESIFGDAVLKERYIYIAEAKLRRRPPNEPFRYFGSRGPFS